MRIQRWLPAGLIATQLCMTAAANAQGAPKDVTGKTLVLQPVSHLQRGRLDLRTPKITELFSQETIDRTLRAAANSNVIEEVEVEARRSGIPLNTPVVWPGPLAPFWALLHPTQAWRILAPLPPDQAELFSGPPPRADDPYRPVMLGPAFQ